MDVMVNIIVHCKKPDELMVLTSSKAIAVLLATCSMQWTVHSRDYRVGLIFYVTGHALGCTLLAGPHYMSHLCGQTGQ